MEERSSGLGRSKFWLTEYEAAFSGGSALVHMKVGATDC